MTRARIRHLVIALELIPAFTITASEAADDARVRRVREIVTALAIAECFVPRGALMLEVISRSGVRRFTSSGPRCAPSLAVEILVDGGTASSAEVLAWLLRRYAHARIRGSRTAGKGTVQEVF